MRKRKPKVRIILPDPKFNDVLVTRFVNNIMLRGKKSIAYGIFYEAIDIVGTKLEKEEMSPLDIWKKSLTNVTPQVEVRSRRIGGATFQIPMEVRASRKESMAMKNMIKAARKRNDKTMAKNLAAEIIAGFKEEGAAFKRKEEIHRMADANKAFSHFRFR